MLNSVTSHPIHQPFGGHSTPSQDGFFSTSMVYHWAYCRHTKFEALSMAPKKVPHFFVALCFVGNGNEHVRWQHDTGQTRRAFFGAATELWSADGHVEHCFQVATDIGCPVQTIVPNPLEGEKVLGRIRRFHLTQKGARSARKWLSCSFTKAFDLKERI